MRKAISLLELILSIVIISIVFVTIPKIIFSINKGFELSLKEEAIYSAIATTGYISSLAWDQHTIDRDGGILSAGGVECNSTTGPHSEGYYRIGGFVGSRNCIGWSDSSNWKPTDTVDIDDGYDDVDDFNGYTQHLVGKRRAYDINITVSRDRDIKSIRVKIISTNTKKESFSKTVVYESVNLGWVNINKAVW